jgi:hypothetical protein
MKSYFNCRLPTLFNDDKIVKKFVGRKLVETVKVGETRISKGFFQYAREKMKIKNEKVLSLESKSTSKLTRFNKN